ncbi:hypothetical protein IAR50_003793 [Cryptococcus sp. DSM 104548]
MSPNDSPDPLPDLSESPRYTLTALRPLPFPPEIIQLIVDQVFLLHKAAPLSPSPFYALLNTSSTMLPLVCTAGYLSTPAMLASSSAGSKSSGSSVKRLSGARWGSRREAAKWPGGWCIWGWSKCW